MAGFDAEAIVVGGGLVGQAAAIALARAGIDTIHLAPPAPPDLRTSALMAPSVDFLRAQGLVVDPAEIGHPLTRIRMIDATKRLVRAPETLFDAAEAGLDAFGWNFSNARLGARFAEVAAGLERLRPRAAKLAGLARAADGYALRLEDETELCAPLVVGADGKASPVRAASGILARETVFEEAALVCDLELERGLGGASVEFHYERGPFTLVPAGGTRANLVWIDARARLDDARGRDEAELTRLFSEKARHLFGAMRLSSPVHVFGLSSLAVDLAGRDGVALVGEAAHAFPPIGAQGLNLGLRDVRDLAAAVAAAGRRDAGWARAVSADYADRRRADLGRTGDMVDTLFRSLLSDLVPAQMLRAGTLWALRASPALRRGAFTLGMGGRA